MRNTFFWILFLFILPLQAQQKLPSLQKQGSATQLVVDGKPFLVIGGELGNSSASSIEDIERIFPKLQRMGLNTVLVPAYWDLTEPTEGTFDFTLTDKGIQQARANDLKVVFLWFGAWKNSMSCYAPLWFKKDYKKYPRAYTKAGKPLEIASSFSENVFQADSKAFSEWMKHIASIDKEGTVIMVQTNGLMHLFRPFSSTIWRRTKSNCTLKCWQNGKAGDSRSRALGRKCSARMSTRMRFLWHGHMRSMWNGWLR